MTDANTGGVYYWNKDTDQVTAIGEAKPVAAYVQQPDPQQQQQPEGTTTMGSALKTNLAFGLGIGTVFAVISRMF